MRCLAKLNLAWCGVGYVLKSRCVLICVIPIIKTLHSALVQNLLQRCYKPNMYSTHVTWNFFISTTSYVLNEYPLEP